MKHAFRAIAFLLTAATAQAQGESASSAGVEAFADWRYSCGADAEGCRVWQRVQLEHEGAAQDILALSLAPTEDGARALLVQTPLDVYLPADLGLKIGGNPERRVRYRNCNERGCWVLIPADASLIAQMKRARTGAVALKLMNGETVRISFSLMGFTDALAAFEAAERADG